MQLNSFYSNLCSIFYCNILNLASEDFKIISDGGMISEQNNSNYLKNVFNFYLMGQGV